MTPLQRRRLIIALLAAPLIITLPVLWPRLQEPRSVERNLDVLLIFVVVPYAAALWLWVGAARSRR